MLQGARQSKPTVGGRRMDQLQHGRYRARIASAATDIEATQRLRYRLFRGPSAGGQNDKAALDRDRFDPLCDHMMIEDIASGRLVCCYRLLRFDTASAVLESYAGQFYGINRLAHQPGPMAEMGRFCLDMGQPDPDVMRLAWAAMAAWVDGAGVKRLLGCASFSGCVPATYLPAFALLRARHLGPDSLLPDVKADEVFAFGAALPNQVPDQVAGLRAMPPLLRSYLAMGGWVSDHAVIDRELNTLHVLVVLEIEAIPKARAAALRALAHPKTAPDCEHHNRPINPA